MPQPASHVSPGLRWAGSKRKLLPRLQTYWLPQYLRYVEPFAGSSALFFRIAPAKALLGDINTDLINAYEHLKCDPDRLYEAISELPRGEEAYYKVRERSTMRVSAFDRAVNFIYLNRFCFNGIYRTNRAGQFNVPYAGKKPGIIPPVEDFRRCSQLLRGARLRASDFGQVLSETRAGDFVYLDPPYAVSAKRVFREYDPDSFALKDLKRLASHLRGMHRRGVHFVVSYADCAEARLLSKEWKKSRVLVRRHVAGFASSRRRAYELLITNVPSEVSDAGE